MNKNFGKTLYLCYFGLREPLVQTQVLPYLRELKKIDDLKISLLTFEPEFKRKWTNEQVESERKKLASEGINWYFLPYHKSPSAPATFYDVMNGTRFVIKLARKEKIDVFHARGHIPAPIGAIAKSVCGGKLLFDIRGFMPEEYTDAGVWQETGQIYKSVKHLEKWLMKKADGFIVLTEKAREILFPESAKTNFDKFGRPVEVIPCCIDAKRLKSIETLDRQASREKLGVENRFVVTHIGSLGGLYLTDNIVEFYAAAKARHSSAFALILTQSNPDLIIPKLREIGFTDKDFLLKKVSPSEVFEYLIAADAALSIVKKSYSSTSRSPTKVAEYLAAGLPIVANSGVGDLDNLIENENIGAILNGFSENDYSAALEKIDELLKDKNLGARCRAAAFENFDLETVGGEKYRRIYKKLLQN